MKYFDVDIAIAVMACAIILLAAASVLIFRSYRKLKYKNMELENLNELRQTFMLWIWRCNFCKY
jgi:hypothetical protein